MINKEIVEYISRLAKIAVDKQDKEFLSSQLSKIVDYIDKLKEVDTDNIQPLRGLHTKESLTRKDKVEINEAREDILKNAPIAMMLPQNPLKRRFRIPGFLLCAF